MRAQVAITHEDVQKAIAQFRARGGLIRKLPDETAIRDSVVHSRTEMQFAVAEPATSSSSTAPSDAA